MGKKRSFVFQDDKSNKFWDIKVDGTGFTVTYGKVGTAGQTSEKEFDDEDECTEAADKLIAEKTKKGYVEQGAGAKAAKPAPAKPAPAAKPAAAQPAAKAAPPAKAAAAASAGVRKFIFQEDKSNKFWNIDVKDTSFTVTYGKVGAAGQTSEKEFDDEDACAEAANKLIAEKTKKGYVEQN